MSHYLLWKIFMIFYNIWKEALDELEFTQYVYRKLGQLL